MFVVAETLGMTAEEVEDRMSVAELFEWGEHLTLKAEAEREALKGR